MAGSLIPLRPERYEFMRQSFLLDPIQILKSSKAPVVKDAVLIIDGYIKAFGEEARKLAHQSDIPTEDSHQKLIAPCLVDPHSILEEPFNSTTETLTSLRKKAARAGYGQIGLLPRGLSWRDRIDRLQGFNNSESDVQMHLWGGFSKDGLGKDLAPHADLLLNGAVGLAEDDSLPSIELIKRGLVLNEIGNSTVLLAPRNQKIQGNGLVREGVEALRAGWPIDPISSETVPISQLLTLQKEHPEIALCLMNISTAVGVSMISTSKIKPMATVSWWHLLQDSSLLSNNDFGYKVIPSLGGPQDKKVLIKGLKEGTITGIGAHCIPINHEEIKKPINSRKPGISGYELILPTLWEELIVKESWGINQLWGALSFGPSRILNMPEEYLSENSRRWLIFDPNKSWIHQKSDKELPYAANEPFQGQEIIGKTINSGLISQ